MCKHGTRISTSVFVTSTNKKPCTGAVEPLKPGCNTGISKPQPKHLLHREVQNVLVFCEPLAVLWEGCVSRCRVGPCHAMCQQGISSLVQQCPSPCPGLLHLLQTRPPGIPQQPQADDFAWSEANLNSWTSHINADMVDKYFINRLADKYLIQSHICSVALWQKSFGL